MAYAYSIVFEEYTRSKNDNFWKLKSSDLFEVVSSYRKVEQILHDKNVTIGKDSKWTFRMFPYETYSYKTTVEGTDVKYVYEIKQWEL